MNNKVIAYYGNHIYGSATYGKIYGFAVKGYVFDQVFVNREQFLAYVEETGCTIINLGDKLCCPSQIDGHNLPALMSRFIRLNSLGRMENPIDAASMIEITLKTKSDEWICLKNWDKSKLNIDRSFLDRLSSERPIVIMEQSLHGAVLNTVALARCISAGMEEFSEDINPDTGHIRAKAFEWYLNNNCPEVQVIEEDILAFEDMLISQGVTSVHDLLVQHPEQIEAYNNLHKQGRLRLRYRLYVSKPEFLKRKSELPIVGVKIFVDGAYGMQTAWQDEAHAYSDGTLGLALMAPEDITEIAEKTVEAGGKQLAAHVIGYAACKAFLDAAQHLKNLPKTKDLILRAEHFETVDEKLLKKARKLGVYVNMQPNFSEDVLTHQDKIKEQAHLNPLELAKQELGEYLSLGTDNMPKSGLIFTVQWALYPPRVHQRLGEKFEDIIPYFSIYPAKITGDDRNMGSIDKGYSADFVIINQYPEHKQDFAKTKVIETFIAGQRIYG